MLEIVKGKKRKNTGYRLITSGAVAALLVVLAIPMLTRAQTYYVEPEGPPPFSAPNYNPVATDSPIEFLNGSSAEQRKVGSLIIGNGSCTSANCGKICLNPPSGNSTDTNCIQDWSDISRFVGGPFLRLLTSSQLAEVDDGFVSVQSNGYRNEFMSIIGEANTGVSGSIGIRGLSTGTFQYAGEFSGTVVAQKQSANTQICLNGSCISSWSGIGGSPADSVSLQTTRNLVKQDGNIGASGSIVSNAIVLGVPSSITNPLWSCGDSVCSAQDGETSATCSADCQ